MTARVTFSILLKRADFLRLNRGWKYVAPLFILRAMPQLRPTQTCRIGYTVTVKCGNAVVRNRIKRRLRALARELLPHLGRAGVDYVIIARADAKPGIAEAAFVELQEQLRKGLVAAAGKFAVQHQEEK